jgi:hypothetical protein
VISGRYIGCDRVARFFMLEYTKMGGNIPNDHIALKYSTCHKILNIA